jgi:DNA replication licensing factor MCM4
VYAYDDLVDAVQPGDRVEITGIYRATPLRVNPRMRTLKATFRVHVDAVHFQKTSKRRLGGDASIDPTAVQG